MIHGDHATKKPLHVTGTADTKTTMNHQKTRGTMAGQHDQGAMKMWPKFTKLPYQISVWQLAAQKINSESHMDGFRALWKKICQCNMMQIKKVTANDVMQWSKKSTGMLSRIITGDKSCVFASNPNTKRLSSQQYINISPYRKHM